MSCIFVDYAWAAGFIQGEGSIFFDRNRRTRQGKLYDQPVIEAFNQDKEPIKRLRELFGGSMVVHIKRGVSKRGIPNKRDVWRWKVCARGALRVAVKIIPYVVGEKKPKLEDFVRFYEAKGVTVHEKVGKP